MPAMSHSTKDTDRSSATRQGALWAEAEAGFDNDLYLAGIPDKLHLLSPMIIQSIATLKQDIMKRKTVSLDLEETLVALSIAATTSPTAELAVAQLGLLRGCEMHMTHIPTPGDDTGLRRLGLNLTCDPQFSSSSLFVV